MLGLGIRLAIVVALDLGSPPASAVAAVVLWLRPATVAAVVVGLGPWLAAVALHLQKSR